MIKISFIIIGYNIENYIERAIKSVQSQTVVDIEIIVVNDGSTDNTRSIIENLAKDDKRIKLINQENQGANSARKNGFLNATGEYILFIDGDDWIENNLSENLYALANYNKYDIIAYAYYLAYNETEKNKRTEKIKEVLEGEEYLDRILTGKISHNLWNKFIKREFLSKAKFTDIPGITMGDDLAANAQLGIYSPKVLVIQEAYYNYFQRVGSVTKDLSSKNLEIETTVDFIENSLKKYGIYEKYTKHIGFLRFRSFFYFVVKSKYKTSYIQKTLYKNWKRYKIQFGKNEFCKEFLSRTRFSERILLYLYNANYYIGYFFSRLYVIFIK